MPYLRAVSNVLVLVLLSPRLAPEGPDSPIDRGASLLSSGNTISAHLNNTPELLYIGAPASGLSYQ
jgi:hypothetical protein